MDRARTRRGWSVPADRSGVPARVTPHDISPRRTVTALRNHGRLKDRPPGTICPTRRPRHPFWTYAPARNFNPPTIHALRRGHTERAAPGRGGRMSDRAARDGRRLARPRPSNATCTPGEHVAMRGHQPDGPPRAPKERTASRATDGVSRRHGRRAASQPTSGVTAPQPTSGVTASRPTGGVTGRVNSRRRLRNSRRPEWGPGTRRRRRGRPRRWRAA